MCPSTSTSTTRSRNCICRTSTVFWTVLIVGPWRCIATGTSTILSLGNDLVHFHHLFHNLKYGDEVRCWMRSCVISRSTSTISSMTWQSAPRFRSKQFLKNHFDTSRSLLRDLTDCHVHNLFNGALFITSSVTAQRSSVVLVNLTSVDDFFQIWALALLQESYAQLQRSPPWLAGISNPRLRPRLAVWTQPPKITILRTSVNFSPDVLSSSVFHHSRTRTWYPVHQRQRQDHPCRRWLHQRCQDGSHNSQSW